MEFEINPKEGNPYYLTPEEEAAIYAPGELREVTEEYFQALLKLDAAKVREINAREALRRAVPPPGTRLS